MLPKWSESCFFIIGSSCLPDREITLSDMMFLSGTSLLMEFLSFLCSITHILCRNIIGCQFLVSPPPPLLMLYLLTIESYATFQCAFIAIMIFRMRVNQWRQLGRVYGWHIISQRSQLDKQHTQDQKASERQGYLESRSPKSWSWTLQHHSTLPTGAARQLGGWRELGFGLVKRSQQCMNDQ